LNSLQLREQRLCRRLLLRSHGNVSGRHRNETHLLLAATLELGIRYIRISHCIFIYFLLNETGSRKAVHVCQNPKHSTLRTTHKLTSSATAFTDLMLRAKVSLPKPIQCPMNLRILAHECVRYELGFVQDLSEETPALSPRMDSERLGIRRFRHVRSR
jgi:hypothetical protein